MKTKQNIKRYSDELYYDFFDGGYLEPIDFLVEKEDIDKVQEAREILRDYFNSIEGAIGEM